MTTTSTTTTTTEDAFVTLTNVNGVPAGTKLTRVNSPFYVVGNTLYSESEVQALPEFFGKENAEVVPMLDVSEVVDTEAYDKLMNAVLNQKAIAAGDRYFFYLVGEKRWGKADMEKTSTDIGRLMAGFVLPITTTSKSKKNRLTTLNKVYDLGLDADEIADIAISE